MDRLSSLFFAVTLVTLFKPFSGQLVIDSPCTLESSGFAGTCRLLTDCDQVKNDVIKLHRLPQTCGFLGTQPIVCCPKEGGPRKPGVISKIKCKEYSIYAHQQGSTSSECAHVIIKRVIGGLGAHEKEFGHMALIGYEKTPGEIKWLCGGSLISEQYVLTAANCASSREVGPPKYVKIGILNRNDTAHKQEVKVAEVIGHPSYRPPSIYNDIALLKLEKPLLLNSYVRPACLYTEDELSATKAIVTGWGTTESGVKSEKLAKATITLVDHDSCYATYKNNSVRILKESQICAGEEGKDSCQGDSGGPLQIHHTGDDITCMYDIIGISSFGPRLCGFKPGIYTRVSHYVKWIEDIVWP